MDGPRDCHTEISKSDRERKISYGITNIWNLKYDTNELIYETGSQTQNRLVVANGHGTDWDLGVQFNSVQSLSRVRLFATP